MIGKAVRSGLARRWLPGLDLLRHYRRGWLRADVLAGVTVAAYSIPQVMAYAEVAGLPPVTGLWALVGTLAVYAVLGSSRQLSVGPESTTALMTAAAIGPLALADSARYAALAATLALLVGVLCVLASVLRLGVLAELLSRPVLVGYLAGVAVVMIVGQLGRVTGVQASGPSIIGQLTAFATNVDQVDWPTVAMSATVLAALVLGSRRFPRFPVPLLVLVGAAAVVAGLGLQRYGITVVGAVPGGVPVPSMPGLNPDDLAILLLPAVGVTVVGYTDNVLTARAFADRNGYTIDPNQELLALVSGQGSSWQHRRFSAHPGGEVDRDQENRDQGCQSGDECRPAGCCGQVTGPGQDPSDGAVFDEPDEHHDRAEADQADADDAGSVSGDRVGLTAELTKEQPEPGDDVTEPGEGDRGPHPREQGAVVCQLLLEVRRRVHRSADRHNGAASISAVISRATTRASRDPPPKPAERSHRTRMGLFYHPVSPSSEVVAPVVARRRWVRAHG